MKLASGCNAWQQISETHGLRLHVRCNEQCFGALQGRKVMQLMVGTSKQLQAVTTSTSGRRDIASLPVPTDPAVRLGIAGGEVVAVFAFEGYITPSSAAAARHKLMKALQEGRLNPLGANIMSI
eukprot:GHRR01001489.1.p1 GENE.GHRR01001489.1~~GHRR01001489.1.p1  ORF type:complete len:124 (-),score=46.45 GHRR01001489.1:674-1045(-)